MKFRSCENCVYFERERCLRFPKSEKTTKYDWCGEFEANLTREEFKKLQEEEVE